MRLKAPEGRGHPVVKGLELKPETDGCYHVDANIGAYLIEAFGYLDADAPPNAATIAKPDDGVLRIAVLASLKSLGVALTGPANDRRLADILVDASKRQNDRVAAEVKAAEDRLINQLDAEITALKTRAETAEVSLADAREVLKAMDEKVAALEAKQPDKPGEKTGA